MVWEGFLPYEKPFVCHPRGVQNKGSSNFPIKDTFFTFLAIFGCCLGYRNELLVVKIGVWEGFLPYEKPFVCHPRGVQNKGFSNFPITDTFFTFLAIFGYWLGVYRKLNSVLLVVDFGVLEGLCPYEKPLVHHPRGVQNTGFRNFPIKDTFLTFFAIFGCWLGYRHELLVL